MRSPCNYCDHASLALMKHALLVKWHVLSLCEQLLFNSWLCVLCLEEVIHPCTL